MALNFGNFTATKKLGDGSFGEVYECFHSQTGEVSAVKVFKASQDLTDLEIEVKMLEYVQQLDPDKYHIVKFKKHFKWNNNQCLAFEMLDQSLCDLQKQKRYFALSEIRVIAKQLLQTFEGLKKLDVVYTDLRKDNIMLVDQKNQPFKVKLRDFGLAYHKSELKLGDSVSPTAFAAPEVSLGLPLTEAIDMWSLGCVLVDLFLGQHPFSGSSTYNNQRTIIKLLGRPSQKLLDEGLCTDSLYTRRSDGKWRLKNELEFYCDSMTYPRVSPGPFEGFSLERAIRTHRIQMYNSDEQEKKYFMDLVKQLLHLDYKKRITPEEALKYPFITMEHLNGHNSHNDLMSRDRISITNKWPRETSVNQNTDNKCPKAEAYRDRPQQPMDYQPSSHTDAEGRSTNNPTNSSHPDLILKQTFKH